MGNQIATVSGNAMRARGDHSTPSSSDHVLKAVCCVSASCREPLYCTPWDDTNTYSGQGSGFVIADPRDLEGGRLVITNAHCVDFAISIRVQRYNAERSFPATVMRLNRDCDLAVLAVDDGDFWVDEDADSGEKQLCPALVLGDMPDLQERVRVVGYPEFGSELCVTQGVVSRIQLRRYEKSELDLLAIQTTSIINNGSSGGPALNDRNEVVGIAFQGNENVGEIIPNCVFQRFLEFAPEAAGELVCVAGIQFSCQNLTDTAAVSSYLKLDQLDGTSSTGIYVTDVGFGSMSETVKVGDVICEIEGVNISNGGTFLLGSHRVGWDHLITSHAVGDIIQIGLVRDGVRMDVKWELDSADSSYLVPENDKRVAEGKKPDFLIIGGLVFVTLSEKSSGALSTFGGGAGYVDNHMREQSAYGLKECEGQELVVVSKVLLNDCIEGYEDVCSSLVETFNGKKVTCLRDMADELKICRDDYLRIQFSVPVFDAVSFVVIDRKKFVEEEAKIFADYRIPFRSRIDGEEDKSLLPSAGSGSAAPQAPYSSSEEDDMDPAGVPGTDESMPRAAREANEKVVNVQSTVAKDAASCSWNCNIRCCLM